MTLWNKRFDLLFYFAIIILIIVMIAYLRLLSCDGTSDNNNDSSKDFDRIEDVYINWLIAAFLFFAAAVYIKNFENNTNIVSVIFFTIVILMLIIINFDYLMGRCQLLNQGVPGRHRLDYLFGIICIVIIVITIFTVDTISQKF